MIPFVHPQLAKIFRLPPRSRPRTPSCWKSSRLPCCGDLSWWDPSHPVGDTYRSVRLRRWPACVYSPSEDSFCCYWRICHVGANSSLSSLLMIVLSSNTRVLRQLEMSFIIQCSTNKHITRIPLCAEKLFPFPKWLFLAIYLQLYQIY